MIMHNQTTKCGIAEQRGPQCASGACKSVAIPEKFITSNKAAKIFALRKSRATL